MDAALTLLALPVMLLAFAAGFFLCLVQPIWSLVDVAGSPRLPTGGKVTLILLTVLLLGPLLTFFYALFGTQSRGLRRSTLVGAAVFAAAVTGVFALAAFQTAIDGERPAAITAAR